MISRRFLFGATVTVIVLAGNGGAGATGSCGWKLSATVKPALTSAFYSVDARAANDVWAVGAQAIRDPGNPNEVGKPLIEHWNGHRWRMVPAGTGELNDLTAIAPDDAWAVGKRQGRAVIEHWDGGVWRIVQSPKIGASFLDSVAAAGPRNVWAVGSRTSRCCAAPLVEHWDGTRWNLVAMPASPKTEELHAVSLSPDGEIWTGCFFSNDGSRWQVRIPPGPGETGCPVVAAIDAHDAQDVWVSGVVLARWDGTRWQRHRLYQDGGSANGIAAISSRDVWVGGTNDCCGGANYDFLDHWNGRRWSRVKSVFPYDIDNGITDIAAISVHNLWAVGWGGGGIARAEHYTCSG